MYIYFKCLTSRKRTIVRLCKSILCRYDIHYIFVWGCLICFIVLVVNLLTGFEAFGSPVKDFALGVSFVILDGASVGQMLKTVGTCTVQ